MLARLDAAFATSDVLSGDETLDEVVTAGNTAALPPLEHLELVSNPELGPKIIATIGKLGKLGSPRERDQAVDTLSQWLESERRREAPDARGNRTALIHALGELNTAAGSTTLTRVLDDDTTPLHVRTLIVEQLALSRLPEAAASIRRFQTRLASAPATDPFEAELLQEAAVAANTALGNPLDPNQNN